MNKMHRDKKMSWINEMNEADGMNRMRRDQGRESKGIKRCIIVGGAPIGDIGKIRGRLEAMGALQSAASEGRTAEREAQGKERSSARKAGGASAGGDAEGRPSLWRYIFCDSGMKHCEALGVQPDLIVGDFDSYEIEEGALPEGAPVIRLPAEKDDTDTAYAVKHALGAGYGVIVLIGVWGGVADHGLANLGLLKRIYDAGARGVILDDHSQLLVAGKERTVVEDAFRYFSLLAVYGEAEQVSIVNAKYPLKEACVTAEDPYAVRNEPLSGGAVISVGKGALLLVKTWSE